MFTASRSEQEFVCECDDKSCNRTTIEHAISFRGRKPIAQSAETECERPAVAVLQLRQSWQGQRNGTGDRSCL